MVQTLKKWANSWLELKKQLPSRFCRQNIHDLKKAISAIESAVFVFKADTRSIKLRICVVRCDFLMLAVYAVNYHLSNFIPTPVFSGSYSFLEALLPKISETCGELSLRCKRAADKLAIQARSGVRKQGKTVKRVEKLSDWQQRMLSTKLEQKEKQDLGPQQFSEITHFKLEAGQTLLAPEEQGFIRYPAILIGKISNKSLEQLTGFGIKKCYVQYWYLQNALLLGTETASLNVAMKQLSKSQSMLVIPKYLQKRFYWCVLPAVVMIGINISDWSPLVLEDSREKTL